MPSYDPNQDPQFLAFQRAQGFSDQEAQGTLAFQQDIRKRRLGRMLDQLGLKRDRGIRDIAFEAASRGAYAGSGRVQNQLEFASDVGNEQIEGIVGNEEQNSLENRQLALERARGQVDLTEKSLGLRRNAALQEFNRPVSEFF